MKCPRCGSSAQIKKENDYYVCGCGHIIRTTTRTCDEILSYVAEHFVSPLCFDSRKGEEIYLEYSSEVFNNFVKFMLDNTEQV